MFNVRKRSDSDLKLIMKYFINLKTLFLIFLLLFQQQFSFSQCVAKGKIIDSTKTPLPFITLALLNNADSSFYKGTATDEKGSFCFSNIKSGSYLLKVFAVGFTEYISSPLQFDSTSTTLLPDIMIHSQVNDLKEISITAIKDPVELKNGNIIINVEDSPMAVVNSLYDLLAQLPGVTIDEGKIAIDGNAGVQLFIDSKMQQMSGQQLINFLRSIHSSGIEKIEILKNPPAKYDAAGTAGVINVKTKKLKMTGFSGDVNYTFSQRSGPGHYAGISLNYKWSKLSVFSGVNFEGGDLKFVRNLNSSVTYNSTTTNLNSKSADYYKSVIPTYNLGMDWYINKKNTIGIKLQDLYAKSVSTTPGNTLLSDNNLGYQELVFNNSVKNDWNYFNANFNIEHLFDTTGTLLKFSTDYYGPTIDHYYGNYINSYYNDMGTPALPSQGFLSNNTVNTQVVASKLDFEKKLSNSLNLEAGIKYSYQKITSDYILQVKDNATGVYNTDNTYTNNFSYEERIAAAYFNLKKEIKKINFQFGLRAENTIVNGKSKTNIFNYNNQYFKVFPVISMDYKKSERTVFQLSYTSRINRPNYNSFNPYKSFVNILMANIGNPYLMPTVHHIINFTYTHKNKVSNSFSYRRVTNPWLNLPIQNDSTKEVVFTPDNLKSSNILAYSLFIRMDLLTWWSLTFNGVASYVDYKGTVNGNNYTASTFACQGYLNNQILLARDYKVEISVNYIGPQLAELSQVKNRFWMNLSIKRALLKDKMSLTIGVDDIFKTSAVQSSVYFQNVNYKSYKYYDTRRLKIGVSYNFGKIKVEQRDTNAGDSEQERLKH